MNAVIFEAIRQRYKCGKPRPETDREKMEKAERAARLIETQQVAAQPHRSGDSGYMAGSNLGKFIKEQFSSDSEDHRIGIYSAANTYLGITNAWRKNRGVRPALRDTYWYFDQLPEDIQAEVEAAGQSMFITDEEMGDKVREWRERLDKWNLAMARAGHSSLAAAKDLILDDRWPHPTMVMWVRRCLQNLAKAQGWD